MLYAGGPQQMNRFPMGPIPKCGWHLPCIPWALDKQTGVYFRFATYLLEILTASCYISYNFKLATVFYVFARKGPSLIEMPFI